MHLADPSLIHSMNKSESMTAQIAAFFCVMNVTLDWVAV